MSETAPNLQDSSAEDLASQIESLLGPTGAQAPPEVPPAAKSESEDLGNQVERMLDDAIEKVNEIAQEAEAEPPAPTSAGPSLDEELTTLAEQLSVEEPAKPEPAKPEPEKPKPEPEPVAAQAPPPPPPPPAPVAQPIPQPVEETPPAAPKRPRINIREVVVRVMGKSVDAVGRVLAFPLSTQRPMIRDSVGWVALVTVFMGACMWAAVLLRDPKPFVPEVPPVSLMTGGGGHGEAKEGHRSGEGESAGSHGAKKESHGAAKPAEKKAGGHGEAAGAAPVKREPLIQRDKSKKPAKEAKKEGGGGH